MVERPDPDQLLEHVQAEEARARRGHLRIFFGASAGVGKTYAMLEAARAVKRLRHRCGRWDMLSRMGASRPSG